MSITVTVREGEAVRVQVGENTAAAAAQAALATSEADRAETEADRSELAAQTTVAASRYFTSQALGEAGSTTGQLFSTDDGAGNLIFYKRTGGGSTEIARAVSSATLDDYARLDTGSSIATNGGRMGITSEATPLVPTALLQMENRQVSTGLRCSSYWTSPYDNNDNSLWETYNKVTSNSANLSWSI